MNEPHHPVPSRTAQPTASARRRRSLASAFDHPRSIARAGRGRHTAHMTNIDTRQRLWPSGAVRRSGEKARPRNGSGCWPGAHRAWVGAKTAVRKGGRLQTRVVHNRTHSYWGTSSSALSEACHHRPAVAAPTLWRRYPTDFQLCNEHKLPPGPSLHAIGQKFSPTIANRAMREASPSWQSRPVPLSRCGC